MMLKENPFKIKKPFVIDVSEHEDKPNWSKCDPRPDVIISRVSYGMGWVDSSFLHNFISCRDLEIPKGAYHYIIANNRSADDQAKYFIKALKDVGGLDDGDLPPILDFEMEGLTAHQIKVWLDRVEDAFGVKPMIYTRADIWETICTRKYGLTIPPTWSGDYPLWCAWYPFTTYIDKNDKIPLSLLPWGWETKGAKGWQYTPSGRLFSMDKYNGYDFNVFDADYLKSLYAETPPDIPPTDPPVEINQETELMTKSSQELTELLKVLDEAERAVDVVLNINIGSSITPTTPDDPSDDDETDGVVMRQIVPRENGSFPVYRTPTTEDIRKIKLTLVGDTVVKTDVPPMKIHNSHVWSTEQELFNVSRNWSWLPRQMVVQNNGKAKMIPNDYIPQGEDDVIWQGCFIEDKYLLGN